MKVKALDTYKRLNIKDKELDRIPNINEIFEVTKERFKVLTIDNMYNEVFVEKVEEVETDTKPKVNRKKK